MVDGALARVRNQKTVFGAFFDSTLDRYSEGLVLLGVLLYAVEQPPSLARTWTIALTYVAALSSLMVSYAKARAEGLGLECKIGFMARPERVVLLAVGLILGGATFVVWTMAALALTSTLTALQRIIHVWRMLRAPTQAHAPALVPPGPTSRPTPQETSNTFNHTPDDGAEQPNQEYESNPRRMSALERADHPRQGDIAPPSSR
jgi:CDP-diacylglycerol--glycerol-3-phosphate 3-phosphatidyltransferase